MISLLLKIFVALPGLVDLANRLLDMIDSWKRQADAHRELRRTEADDLDIATAVANAKDKVDGLNSRWNGD